MGELLLIVGLGFLYIAVAGMAGEKMLNKAIDNRQGRNYH